MKTIKQRKNLNGITAFDILDRADYYSVLCLEDVDRIHFHDDIIDESVLRDETIQELFNYCMKSKRTLMNVKEVMDRIPIGNKWHKILAKSKSYEHRLYVDICDFSGTSFYDELKYFSKNEIPNDILIQKAVELTKKFNKYIDGGFVTFDNHREFGILFLNERNGKNIFTFKHELIHYFNWIKGAFKNSTSADEAFYTEEINAIHTYINKNFYVDHLKYITSSDEYENLLNNFLDLLKEIKENYFSEMNSYDFAKKITSILILKESHFSEIIKESPKEYCKRIMTYDFFKKIRNQSSFNMILFFMMINHKVTNIKNHIFGAFS